MNTSLLAADLDYILRYTSVIWDELKNSSLFLTGGTGFIGCWLLETFAWANSQLNLNLSVTVLTRDIQKFTFKAPHLVNNSQFHFITGDVRNFNFPQDRFSHCIHAATEASEKLNRENPHLMLDTIVQGTERVLQFSVHSSIKKLLLLSSGAIYGKQPATISHFRENDDSGFEEANTPSAYGKGKRAAEALCLAHAKQYQTEIKIARGFAFVGPYLPLDTHFAIGNFIQDGLAGRAIHIKSDGRAYRSYQYAADLIISLLHILCRGEAGKAYNIGSEEAISIAELAHLVAACFHPSPAIWLAHAPANQLPPERYIPCVERLRQDLGLSMKINLRDAILKTINWHKQKTF